MGTTQTTHPMADMTYYSKIPNVTRVVLIDNSRPQNINEKTGTLFEKKNILAEVAIEDAGKTLKIVINDKPSVEKLLKVDEVAEVIKDLMCGATNADSIAKANHFLKSIGHGNED